MAILHQDPKSTLKYRGWYGTCKDCNEYSLVFHTSIISKVTQYYIERIDEDGRYGSLSVVEFNSDLPSSLWDFSTLKCGVMYEFTLKKGTGFVDIPNLIISEYDKGDQGRIVNDCEPYIEPILKPLEFRCELINGRSVLQVRNNLKPLHKNFVSRNTEVDWSSVYTYNPPHSFMDEDAHDLKDPYWADVAVSPEFAENIIGGKCCKTDNSFLVNESTKENFSGTTPPNDAYVNANSFAFEGELCIGNSKGGLPSSVLLYIGKTEKGNHIQYPIGKIDTMGGLDSNEISFKVTKNSSNKNFAENIKGQCFKGIISEDGETCILNFQANHEVISYANINDNVITLIKKENRGYLQAYVNGKASFIFAGDENPNNTAQFGNSVYPVVLCEPDTQTPTPNPQPTPTPEKTPTPTQTPTPTPFTCCSNFPVSINLINGTQENLGQNYVSVFSSPEDDGVLCMSILTEANPKIENSVTSVSFIDENFTNGGFSINVQGIYNGTKMRYTRNSDGKCFEGTLDLTKNINVWNEIN